MLYVQTEYINVRHACELKTRAVCSVYICSHSIEISYFALTCASQPANSPQQQQRPSQHYRLHNIIGCKQNNKRAYASSFTHAPNTERHTHN